MGGGEAGQDGGFELNEDLPPPHLNLTVHTHMHQGVVRLFARVKQEVERPAVRSPLDSCKEGREKKTSADQPVVDTPCSAWLIQSM